MSNLFDRQEKVINLLFIWISPKQSNRILSFVRDGEIWRLWLEENVNLAALSTFAHCVGHKELKLVAGARVKLGNVHQSLKAKFGMKDVRFHVYFRLASVH